MASLQELKKEAKKQANNKHGHKLGKFVNWKDKSAAVAECKSCGCDVLVRTVPKKGETEIQGTAIDYNCQWFQDKLDKLKKEEW